MTYPLVKKSEILKNDLILKMTYLLVKNIKIYHDGLILMGDLPNNEKYKDFSEWSNFYGWSTQLLKNTKIFQEKKII